MNNRLNRSGNLRHFIDAARRAAEDDNWFAAIALALTLPDICGAVDDPGKGRSAARFIAWWDERMAWRFVVRPDADEQPQWEPFTYLPGADAFALRCAYLHSGTDNTAGPKTNHERIRFLGPPNASGFGYSETDQILYLGLEPFVEWVCLAVEDWLADRASDPVAQERLTGLVSVVPSTIRIFGRHRQP